MPAAFFLASLSAAVPGPASVPRPVLAPSSSVARLDDAQDRYHFISGLAEKGLAEQVVREATRFLEELPRAEQADLVRYRLASALFDLGRLADARPHFARLAALDGFRYADEVRFRHGQCELEAGALESAEAAFLRVRDGAQEYLRTPAMFLAGEAAFRAGRYAAAIERYRAVLAAEDGAEHRVDAHHALVWCLYESGEHAAALQELSTLLRGGGLAGDDPRVAELAFLAGECQLELGRTDQALAAYSQVRGGPFHDAALRGAGFAYAERGEHRAAAETFGALLQRYPDSRFAAEASLHRGIQLLRLDAAEEALAALEGPGSAPDPERDYWRARALAALGRHERALAALEEGLAREPADELATRLAVARADALFELGRTAEAAQAYERSGSDYALHAAAVARLNDGEHEEAARLASALVAEGRGGPYRVAAALTLGEARFALAQYGPARKAFQLVLDEDASPAERALAATRLGWCAYLEGDLDGARRDFLAAASGWPDAPEAEEARYMAARVAGEQGAPDERELLTAYLRAHADGPHKDDVDLRLARLEPAQAGEKRLRALLEREADPALVRRARFDLAERLSAREAYADAEPHYVAFLADAPQDELAPAAHYGLAWCLRARGAQAEALDQLEAVGEAAPAEVARSAAELAVWCAHDAPAPDRARAAWQRFVARCDLAAEGDAARALELARVAAECLCAAERASDADDLYALLLDRTRDRSCAVGVCVERSYLALERGDVARAASHVRTALEVAPDDPALLEALFFVGERRYEAGEDAEAIRAYTDAARSSDSVAAARALYKLGFTHLRGAAPDSLDRAAQAFETLAREHGGSELFGEALFLAGEAHFRAGRDAQAIEWLARVPAEVPKHAVLAKALFRLGVAQARAERWEDAAQTLAQLAKRFPDFEAGTEAELWRGRALAGLGQRRAARTALERVIERDQGVLAARAHLELGRLALAEGQRDDALSKFLYVSVLFAQPEEVAEALFYAGGVLELQGDREAAVARYREAVRDHPSTAFGARAQRRLDELSATGG